jgi:hypothetical protein
MLDKLAGPPLIQASPAKPVVPSTQAATQAAAAVSATAIAVSR